MFGFDKMFDFNRDGKLDSWERAAQFQFMDEMMKKVSLMTTMRLILLRMPDLIMMSWNLWIPNIYQSTQVLSVTFIRSANSHYSFVFLRNYPFG